MIKESTAKPARQVIGTPRSQGIFAAFLHLLAAAFMLPPFAVAAAGDSDHDKLFRYGEQLAQECLTCHRRDGKDLGIPAITFMSEKELADALILYKTGRRLNKVMVSVATSLDETQMRALAIYLSFLGKRPEQKSEQLVRQTEKSVYLVRAMGGSRSGSGSGFLAAGKRHVVTNFHVVQGMEEFRLEFLDGKKQRSTVPAKVVLKSEQKDLAVLEADSDLPGEPLGVARYRPEKISRIFAVGFPGAADVSKGGTDSLEASFANGTVSRVVADAAFTHGLVVQHNANINPGNSGGPLVDDCGVVVGINTYHIRASQGLSFAVSSLELVELIKAHSLPAKTVENPCSGGGTSAGSDIVAGREPERSGNSPDNEGENKGKATQEHEDEAHGTINSPEDSKSSDANRRAAAAKAEQEQFARLQECATSAPCNAETCKLQYSTAVSDLDYGVGGPIDRQAELQSLITASQQSCLGQGAWAELGQLRACAQQSPCRFAEQCLAAATGSLTAEQRTLVSSEIDGVQADARNECTRLAALIPPSPVPPPAPVPQPNRERVIGVRDYYAELRYDASRIPSQELVSGNCLGQTVKITVTSDYTVSWILREGTRRSRWRGTVDPYTGEIKASIDVLELRQADGTYAPVAPAPSAASGEFVTTRLQFAPCGVGSLAVRN